ncbi:MAG: elongation factor G [Candidatus Parcubacteria bacterium]|nr:MAG: elongation factor G [Candidatus Parcubacteria bacterium]
MVREYPIEKTRNIGIIAHIDAGKTTTTERILYYTGMSHKIGEVHEGTTITDWMPQERERGITITAASVTCFWVQSYVQKSKTREDNVKKEFKINIIDTPGHVDFTAEVERSLRILDGAVVVFDGVQGVEAQSETVWHQADKYNVPRICFINKLDRMGASFDDSLKSINDRLTKNAVPVVIPVGLEENFRALIDLITMELVEFEGEKGEIVNRKQIPDNLLPEAERYRKLMLEKLAESDEEFMNKYLEEDFNENDIRSAIRRACIKYEFIPVYCGSSLKNKGVQLVLDGVVDFLPSPLDLNEFRGIDPKTGVEILRKPSDEDHFSALAFKLAIDPFVGTLTYIRIYSGVLNRGDTVLNTRTNETFRIGRLVVMHANQREEVETLFAGDIGAIVGVKDLKTGDTICDPKYPVIFESIKFTDPVIWMKIEPKTKQDQEKMGVYLKALSDEDPTFKIKVDPETGDTLIGGMGELHLEIMVDRLRREFKVETNVGVPQVAYRETITKSVEAEGKYIRQSGGRGQYGHVVIKVEPLERNKGFEFINAIKGGIIPDNFIPAVEKGLRETIEKGIIAGYPVTDIKVTLFDGSFHEVDSSDLAFKIAAEIALKDAVKKANPIFLEPIMKLEVFVPSEFLGDVTGDLASRRAKIEEVGDVGEMKKIFAKVPLSEMFGYVTILRSLTQGRGFSYMEFYNYQEVPQYLFDNIINNRQISRK